MSSAFIASGRFNVMVATPSARSRSTDPDSALEVAAGAASGLVMFCRLLVLTSSFCARGAQSV